MAGNNRLDGFKWNHTNVDDFEKFIEDNAAKVDGGLAVLKTVMARADDIVAAACVRRFRQKGWTQERTETLCDAMVKRIPEVVKATRETALADCARIFAGTGSEADVMLMAFVVYSSAGVDLADAMIASVGG